MAYIAPDPESYQNTVVGSGQCVAYVQQASGAPLTSGWSQGSQVRGNADIQTGTAIATFNSDGQYTDSTDGTSHAAIYIGQNGVGLQVWDQWKGQPVHQRTIRFQGGAPGVKPVNDGDAFYVID
ncbi:MAG: BPSL0067 family protein [Candidatus Korobacteraceae bacterium]